MNVDGLRSWYQYYRTAVNPHLKSDPELKEGSLGAEELFSNLGDFYAVSSWKWNKSEKNTGTDSIVDTRFIPQEEQSSENLEVEFEAKPVVYEYDPKELEEWKKYEEKMKVEIAEEEAVKEASEEVPFIDLEKELDVVTVL